MHKPGQRDERASSLAGLACQGEHPAGDFAPKFHAAHLPPHRQGADTLSLKKALEEAQKKMESPHGSSN